MKLIKKKKIKPYALMMKLLSIWEFNTMQEVSKNHEHANDLNEFWLKYAFSEQNGIIFFIS